VGGDAALEVGQLGGVAVEQVEHVLGGADRALDAAQRVALDEVVEALEATSSSSAAVANRLPSVVIWAATLWERPVIGWSRVLHGAAERRRARQRWRRCGSRTLRAASTWSCSTFSVRSRDVMPLWMCSWPARR
jgi:hypothetical protein